LGDDVPTELSSSVFLAASRSGEVAQTCMPLRVKWGGSPPVVESIAMTSVRAPVPPLATTRPPCRGCARRLPQEASVCPLAGRDTRRVEKLHTRAAEVLEGAAGAPCSHYCRGRYRVLVASDEPRHQVSGTSFPTAGRTRLHSVRH